MPSLRASTLAGLAGLAAAQIPNRPATWVMNQSTIIMPCNNSGFTDPKSTVGWAIIDFDARTAEQSRPPSTATH